MSVDGFAIGIRYLYWDKISPEEKIEITARSNMTHNSWLQLLLKEPDILEQYEAANFMIELENRDGLKVHGEIVILTVSE